MALQKVIKVFSFNKTYLNERRLKLGEQLVLVTHELTKMPTISRDDIVGISYIYIKINEDYEMRLF